MHALLGGQLPVLPRAWSPGNAGASPDGKKQVQSREALGSLTELKIYPRGLGNCANVGSSQGALALLKRHFGLAIEVERQGQEQARQRRESLKDRVAFLHPSPVHPPAGHT